MNDLLDKAVPNDDATLPEGRVTNRQMAEFVSARIDEVKDTFSRDQRALKTEIRWWLTSFAAVYQFHLDLTFFGGAFVAYLGWTKLMPRLPFFNR